MLTFVQMKISAIVIIIFIVFSSCKEQYSEQQQKKQDSLFTILHFQIMNLKTFSKPNTYHFAKPDSLFAADSVLYQSLIINYTKAFNVIDSILHITPKIISESDTLFKYSTTYDTAITNRLNYLIEHNKNYIQEYYKASAIIEQNEKLIKLFDTLAHQ